MIKVMPVEGREKKKNGEGMEKRMEWSRREEG